MVKHSELVISIVNYNCEKYLPICLDSVLNALKNCAFYSKVVCVDNNSVDRSREILNQYTKVEKIFMNENLGFAAAHNLVMNRYDAKYFLLLNPDTNIIDESNLSVMMNFMELNPEIALATCAITDDNDKPLPAVAHQPTLTNGIIEQLKINKFIHNSPFFGTVGKKLKTIFPVILNNFGDQSTLDLNELEIDFIYGTYLFIRKSALDSIGLFDEHFFLFWEEVDLCIRSRELGYKIGYNGTTRIVHYSQYSQSSVKESSYYWHVASLIWIFKKYFFSKFVLYCVISFFIQFFFVSYHVVFGRSKWMKIHLSLLWLSLSFGTRYDILMQAIRKWNTKFLYV